MSYTNDIHSTIGVKQGCILSATHFGLYIDELEDLIVEAMGHTA
jgi:hypothetical protein